MACSVQTGFRGRFSTWYEQPTISGSIVFAFLLALVVTASSSWSNIPLLAGFVLVLILPLLRAEGYRGLGFRSPGAWPRVFLTAIVLAAALEFGSSIVIEPFAERLTGDKSDFSMFDSMEGNIQITLMWLATGWVIGGFLEEMFFRGFLVQEIGRLLGERQSGYVIGVLLSSVIFGLAHFYQGPTGMIMTGLFGFFFGVLYLLNNRNIWLNILVHGFVDTIGFTLLYFGKYDDLREILPL